MSKKKKVRVAFKKNRQKRTRANDLTRGYRQDDPAPAEPAMGERIRAKGDLSRHRTIVTEETQAAGESSSESPTDSEAVASRAVDLSTCLPGRVTRVHGLLSIVEADDGQTFSCHVRRILKTLSIEGRNVLAVGDRVWFRPGGPAGVEGLIEKVEARRGTITRGYRRREHVIASNVDQVLIVSAFEEPGLKLPRIDRYLILAETGWVRPIIVLNKAPLWDTIARPPGWICSPWAVLNPNEIWSVAL